MSDSLEEKRQEEKLNSCVEPKILKYDLAKDGNFEKLKYCVIPVFIEGQKNKQMFDLLVDTGATHTVLAPEIAEIIGIDESKYFKGTQVDGSSRYKKGEVNLIIGRNNGKSLSWKTTTVFVGKIEIKFIKCNILGLLGANTMQDICLKIDYKEKYLEFSY